MAKLDEAPILDLGKMPVPGAAPCGADVAEDEQYIAVSKELSKLGRIDIQVEEGEDPNPNWFIVEQSAIGILRGKSKDAEMATALGYALFKRYGYEGLAATLGMLTELVRNFWDGMFPERPRRRKARIESLADQFADGGWFKENQPKGDGDFDALDICAVRIEELTAALTEKMADEPPDFSKFVRGLKEQVAKRPKAAPPPAAAAEGGAPAGGGFTGGEVVSVESAVVEIRKALAYIQKTDPTDPLSYAVIRLIKWSPVSVTAGDPLNAQVPTPEGQALESLTHQFNNGLWDVLLQGAEDAFWSEDPLWLDLQRFVCAAMLNLGPQYEKARQAILTVLAGLVRRLGHSGLYDLKFRNGTPLCSGETKMWIETEVTPPQGGGGSGNAGGGSNGKLTEATDKAKQLAGAGKLSEGLKALQEGLAVCTQRRDRFLWRLQIAKLCHDAKRLQLAAPLLEECYEEIRRYRIDEWEPALAVEVAKTLYQCRKALTTGEPPPAPEALQRVQDSFAWLCQLDPLTALAVEPAGA